jgi:single-stranded DNA-binding protein
MFCKNCITLIGFLGKDAETRFTSNGQPTLGYCALAISPPTELAANT